MVHYLQRFCLITLCRRSNTTFHITNVSTHTLFTDIPFSSALQFLHNHVRFYDNTFLRHVTSKYFIDAILLLMRSLLNYLQLFSYQTAGVLGNFAVTIMSLMYFIQVFVNDSSSVPFWLVSLLSPTGVALAMDKVCIAVYNNLLEQ